MIGLSSGECAGFSTLIHARRPFPSERARSPSRPVDTEQLEVRTTYAPSVIAPSTSSKIGRDVNGPAGNATPDRARHRAGVQALDRSRDPSASRSTPGSSWTRIQECSRRSGLARPARCHARGSRSARPHRRSIPQTWVESSPDIRHRADVRRRAAVSLRPAAPTGRRETDSRGSMATLHAPSAGTRPIGVTVKCGEEFAKRNA